MGIKLPSTSLQKYNLIDGQVVEIVRAIVHRFTISDTPDYQEQAEELMAEWLATELGQFVLDHAVAEPEFHRVYDISAMGYSYAISAHFTAKDYTFLKLKWSNKI